MAPAILLLATLVGYPFLLSLYLATSDAVLGNPGHFVGPAQFARLLGQQIFQQTLQNTAIYALAAVAAKVVLGMTLALILAGFSRHRLPGSRLVRAMILLPWIVPTALSTVGWKWMFEPQFSVINWTLVRLGTIHYISDLQWLGEANLARVAVIMVNVWRGVPFFAINLLAGLIAIPDDLYEAAEADGATPWAKFWLITLPLLRPVLATVVLFSLIMTISDFNIVYVLTRGGPLNSTHLLPTLAHQVGLLTGELGRGAAVSLFMLPFLMIVVFYQMRLMRRAWEW
ncbi:MAG: sugar ABC transporter permease [Armatimonadota bacterium]|nr:sugar ABC transporter permease [Armatimonadota bacterium]